MKNNPIQSNLSVLFCTFAASCATSIQNGGRNATPVFVTESSPSVQANAEYLGSVAASDEVGYRKCSSLYGALANQARKMGGNAVFFAGGDRHFTLFSWSAPTAKGKAYRVRNLGSLTTLPGKFYGASSGAPAQRMQSSAAPNRNLNHESRRAGFGSTQYLPGVQ